MPSGKWEHRSPEVGMGDKSPELRALAESYIKRGTLRVMTVKMERDGEFDFAWSYSLYRRDKEKSSSGQLTTYDVVCDAQDVRAKRNNNVVEFPAGLTLFDFVLSSILEKNGVTCRKDKKAALHLSMSSEELDETEARLVDHLERGNHISEQLKEIEKLFLCA
jgi:hypothetical protein